MMTGTLTPDRRDGRRESGRSAKEGQKNFFAPGGQHNPLKRLNPDKEIQENPSLFLCFFLSGLCWDFAAFG